MKTLVMILSLTLVLAACGNGEEPTDPGPGATPPADGGPTPLVAGETPEATFAAVRAATLRQDWDALYELNAPSEIEESEARWEKVKHDPEKEADLGVVAGELGFTIDELRALSLRDYFMHRNAKQAAGHSSPMMRMAHEAKYVGETPVPDKEGVVMVKFQIGESTPEMPMKLEDGRWYLWKMLTAMSSY